MAIPWAVWLIVGAGMAFWSLRIGDKFLLFQYVGYLFVIIGVGKALVGFVLRPKKEEVQAQRIIPAAQTPRPQPHVAHHAHAQHPAAPPQLRQTQFSCPRCRHPLSPAGRFCHMCGLQIR